MTTYDKHLFFGFHLLLSCHKKLAMELDISWILSVWLLDSVTESWMHGGSALRGGTAHYKDCGSTVVFARWILCSLFM